jgi:hypothetical protein
MNVIFTIAVGIAIALGGWGIVTPDEYGGFDAFGAISFPTSLDTFTNPTASSQTNSPSHATQHANANDGVEALEAKVGIDGSAVTSSHDYKLSGVTGSDKACSLAGTETLTNKTLTSPYITTATASSTNLVGTTSIDLGSDATGDLFYRDASGDLERIAIGSNGQFLEVSSGLPAWVTTGGGDTVTVYSATSTSHSTANTIAVTANDVLIMWAEFDYANCEDGGSREVRGSLIYKQSTRAASTTVKSVVDQAGLAVGCNAVAMGTFTATTTENINVRAQLDEGDYSSLVVQRIQ